MKEEMYIPGQDDFPGWDEFYRSRPLSRERMRYSVKTVLLLPPILGLALAMFLFGYQKGNKDEFALRTKLDIATTQRAAAESKRATSEAAAALEQQIREQTIEETRSVMKALIALAIDLRIKTATTPGFREAGKQMLGQLAIRLKQTAATLHAATAADFDSKAAMAENSALIWSHLDLGEALAIAGSFTEEGDADARRQFQEAQDLARSIAHYHASSAPSLLNLFVVEARFGDFNWQSGRSEAARENYEEALGTAAEFGVMAPAKALPQRTIAVLLASEGDTQLQSGLPLLAADTYQDAIDMMRAQATKKAESTESRRDLAVLYGKLGDARLLAADPTQTMDSHQGRFNVNWIIVIRDPQSPGPMRDDYSRFTVSSDANRQSDNLTRAREAYRNNLVLVKNIDKLDAEANAPETAHALARLGCLEIAAESYATASTSLEKAMTILAHLPRDGPSASDESDAQDAPYAVAALVGGEAFAIACERSNGGTRNLSISTARDAASMMSAAAVVAKSDARERCVKDLREKLAFCKSALLAIDDLGFIRKQPQSEIPRWLAIRGRALARAGRADDAAPTADLLVRTEPRRGDNLLAAAEIYAILARGVKSAAASDGDSPDNNREGKPDALVRSKVVLSESQETNKLLKLKDSYASRAVKLLRDAADAGYPGNVKNPSSTLLANSNLAALVGRDDFQSLLVGLDAAAAEKAQKPK
jgi:hypothetical protein